MSVKITDGFDVSDDEKAIEILKKWKGGPISDQLFAQISLMTPQISMIISVFRNNAGKLETLLLPRPKTDPTWPGMLNLPGKMFRSADFKRFDGSPLNGPKERIIKDELSILLETEPKFAGIAFQNTKRGPIAVLVYTVEVPPDFEGNKDWVWRDVKTLEEFSDMIPTEMDAIKVALKSI